MSVHHFSVDVEEYFQVSAFERFVARDAWDRIDSRVGQQVDQLLHLLAGHETTGTFFVLGWLAERQPEMVKAIAAAGHEIASHGWGHRRVPELTPAAFRESVRRTKATLEAIVGEPVVGFRAPSFSIVPGTEWALDILVEEGYRYDSSLFPVRRSGYGYPEGARDPHTLQRAGGPLHEIPPATLRRFGRNLPAGGGGYFRLFPYGLVARALREAEARGVPATFYVHPWEIDPDQPRLRVPLTTRLRHYGGIGRTRRRLERLLRDFRFTAIRDTLGTPAPAS